MVKYLLSRVAYAALRRGYRLPRFEVLTRLNEKQSLIDLLKRLRINCFIDVGANKGTYAKSLRDLGYEGSIFCFEPILEDFEHILEISKGDESWKTFNFAIGSRDTQSKFNIIRTGPQTVLSSLWETSYVTSESIEKTTVPVRRLDSVFRDEAIPRGDLRIFLKTDTQGNDLEVVKGAGELLPYMMGIQCEIAVVPMYKQCPRYIEALSFLESLDYSLFNLNVVLRAENGCIREYDCLMARVDELSAPA